MLRCLAAVVLIVSTVRAETITVAAAASLKETLSDVAAAYTAESGTQIRFNFDGSGKLAAQIRQGAPVDVFVAADDESMDSLVAAGLVDAVGVRPVAGNRLVLVTPPAGGTVSFAELTHVDGRIAIGDPATVPAGRYAVQVFQSLGIDRAIAPRLIYGQNVREVLTLVGRGEVAVGVVYRTDATAGDVRVAAVADASWHRPIRYPAAVLKPSTHADAARRFVDFLTTPMARSIFSRHGFDPPTAAAVFPSPSDVDSNSTLWRSVALSVAVATAATALATITALTLAMALRRRRFPGRRLIEAVALLPLVMPPTVVGYVLVVIFGRYGWFGRISGGYTPLFRPEGGILAAAVVAFPLAYLPIKAALAGVSREMEDVARLMGAGRWAVFRHVSLPLARRGIIAGCLLAFGRAVGEFGATTMVMGTGPDRQTLPVAIYVRTMTDHLSSAAAPVAALAAVSLVVVLLSDRSNPLRNE